MFEVREPAHRDTDSRKYGMEIKTNGAETLMEVLKERMERMVARKGWPDQ